MDDLITGTRVKMKSAKRHRWREDEAALVMDVRRHDVLLRFSGGDEAHVLPSEFEVLSPPRHCPECGQIVAN